MSTPHSNSYTAHWHPPCTSLIHRANGDNSGWLLADDGGARVWRGGDADQPGGDRQGEVCQVLAWSGAAQDLRQHYHLPGEGEGLLRWVSLLVFAATLIFLTASCSLSPGPVLTGILEYVAFSLMNFWSLNNLLKLVLYFSHYLISSFKFTADEIMGEVQHQFQEVKMVLKTRNSS